MSTTQSVPWCGYMESGWWLVGCKQQGFGGDKRVRRSSGCGKLVSAGTAVATVVRRLLCGGFRHTSRLTDPTFLPATTQVFCVLFLFFVLLFPPYIHFWACCSEVRQAYDRHSQHLLVCRKCSVTNTCINGAHVPGTQVSLYLQVLTGGASAAAAVTGVSVGWAARHNNLL